MNAYFHRKNRQRFIDSMPDNSVAVFFSGDMKRRSNDVFYEFEVDKNFWYLTGADRENMALMIKKQADTATEIFFMLNHDIEKEKWFGKQLYPSQLIDITGISAIEDFRDFEKILYSNLYVADSLLLYFQFLNRDEEYNGYYRLAKKIKQDFPSIAIQNSLEIMTALRYIKTDWEIENIKQSTALIKEGLLKAEEKIIAGNYEYQVKNAYENHARSRGENIYGTVAASGVNAVYLHHTHQNDIIKDGDLFLIDVGAKTNGYFGDITRVFAVSGRFSDRQRMVYDIVLEAELAAISAAKEGVFEGELNEIVKDIFSKHLMKIGLITSKEEVLKYYYHNIGHPLGLDVHDLRPQNRILKDRSVYTIEPGLYIKEWEIGIRIEDDILITKDGNVVLSSDIPK